MNIADAHRLAEELVATYAIHPVPIEFTTDTDFLGRCHFDDHQATLIELSRPWVQHLDEAEVRDVILHEIAHVNVGYDPHGPAWEREVERLGARPEPAAAVSNRLFFQVQMSGYHYTAVCDNPDCPEPRQIFFNGHERPDHHLGVLCDVCDHAMRVVDQRADPDEAAAIVNHTAYVMPPTD